KTAGDRQWFGPRLGALRARLEGPDHRRAAGGLYRVQPRGGSLNPSGLSQLKKRAPHPDQPSAAAGGIDDCVRQGPAQLLSQFQAQRLLALDAVGFAKRRDVERSGSRRQLARGTSAIADVTVDEAQFCAE